MVQVASPTELVDVAPGKKMNSHGVVVVENYIYLPTRTPGHDAVGITSWPVLTYHDTFGAITQFKFDEWESGGGFKLHCHADPQPMDELFVVIEGEATFTFGPSKHDDLVTLALHKRSAIYFPAGVWHSGRNESNRPNTVLIMGLRAGFRHECDAGKGVNVPQQ